MAEDSKGGESKGSKDSSDSDSSKKQDDDSQEDGSSSEENSEEEQSEESDTKCSSQYQKDKNDKKAPAKNKIYGGNKVYMQSGKAVKRYENGTEIIQYDTPISQETIDSIDEGELEKRVNDHQRCVGKHPVGDFVLKSYRDAEESSPYRGLLEARAKGKPKSYDTPSHEAPKGRLAMSSGRLVVLGPGYTTPIYRLN